MGAAVAVSHIYIYIYIYTVEQNDTTYRYALVVACRLQ